MCDFFDLFCVSNVFDIQDDYLHSKYLELCREFHPDSCKVSDASFCLEKMEKINKAYGILKSPLKRSEYLLGSNFINPSSKVISAIYDEIEVMHENSSLLRKVIIDCQKSFALALKNIDYNLASDVLFKWKLVNKLFNGVTSG